MINVEEESLKTFIHNILSQRGNVNDENIARLYTTKEALFEFKKCMTHWSIDPDNNYELYEWLGDRVVNNVVAHYIHARFPKIKNEKWLTRIKNNLVSSAYLRVIIEKYGFMRFFRFDPAKAFPKNPQHYLRSADYSKMIGDIFEGFIGCVEELTNRHCSIGVGYGICHNIISSYLNEQVISTEIQDVFDTVTRLKELFEMDISGLHWPIDKAYKIDKQPIQGKVKWSVTIYGWPLGDRKPTDENRVILAKNVQGKSKGEARSAAASLALKTLVEAYGIREKLPDMYEGFL